MTGQCDKLINFVSKFIGTVRFGHGRSVAIMGYGYLPFGNILTRVYYVEGLGHNLFLVRYLRIDNSIEFINQTLRSYMEEVGITHQTSIARTPQQNDLKFLHVFGALCYPTNDSEDLGKLNAKADIGISIGYSPSKKAYRIYNKRTRMIMETIHVQFDELTQMASEQFSSGPEL
ncbi:retrovirus-related pol polyprotein from transposon TNT 1-94 [Tanacetum coccineum]